MAQRSPKKRGTSPQVADDWDAFEGTLANALRECDDRRDQAKTTPHDEIMPHDRITPYNDAEGTLKRLTYAFVRSQLQIGAAAYLEKYLADVLNPETSRRSTSKKILGPHHRKIKFDENPFNYALEVLNFKGYTIKRDVRSRYARQLIYAHRHDINPNLLIGFLHQSGGQLIVAEKAKNPGLEYWFDREQGASRSSEDFPLVVIDFDATDQSLDGFPVCMARATAKDATTAPRASSTLIKPDRSWRIEEQWYTDFGKGIEVSRKQLLTAREPIDVLESMSAYTKNVRNVYCYDMRLCSYWLDTVADAAGFHFDFKLKDVGDFFNHDITKRIALRAEIRDSQRLPKAKDRAEALCNALADMADEA